MSLVVAMMSWIEPWRIVRDLEKTVELSNLAKKNVQSGYKA